MYRIGGLAVANISQEQSMYADDKTASAVTDADNNSGYTCSECKNIIIGGRITCVQCVSYDLCAVCASEQNAIEHCDHYLLRVPPHRPPDEVQMVLQAVRSLLDNAKADVAVTPPHIHVAYVNSEVKHEFEAYDDPVSTQVVSQDSDEVQMVLQAVRSLLDNAKADVAVTPPNIHVEYVNSEVKHEFEAYDDPLSTKVESQDLQTQKRAAPIDGTEDEIPQYMYENIKEEPIGEESTLTEVPQTQICAAPIVGTEDEIPQYMYENIKEEPIGEESTLTEVPVPNLANEQDDRRLRLIVAPVKLTSNAADSPNEMSESLDKGSGSGNNDKPAEGSVNSNRKEQNKKPHIKKPLNAFMLYIKEMRAKVVAECTLKASPAAINQILGKRWHALGREEQAKYYELARRERQLHKQLYPGWSSRANKMGKKRKRKRKTSDEGILPENNLKKCRARYGLGQKNQWCKPCRIKKKCVRYMEALALARQRQELCICRRGCAAGGDVRRVE